MGGKKKYIEMFGSFMEPFKYYHWFYLMSEFYTFVTSRVRFP